MIQDCSVCARVVCTVNVVATTIEQLDENERIWQDIHLSYRDTHLVCRTITFLAGGAGAFHTK
ncbi:hypothetical protein [Methanosarcina mazei]|uniref:hypothetical protein n=1 Tax=Methanosarcina mazei TaxID=2209 RepID=UPI00064E8E77|nr:hypothetical protein [Methanosarcina mazei]